MFTTLILLATTTTAAAENDVQALADHLMAKGGTPAGICAVLRCGDGGLAVALAKSQRAKMWVYAQDDRPDMVAARGRRPTPRGCWESRCSSDRNCWAPCPSRVITWICYW